MPNVVRPQSETKVPGPGDPEVKRWKARLELAEKRLFKKGGNMRRESAGDVDAGVIPWKDLIAFFSGEQWPAGRGGRARTFDRITSNLSKSNIDSIRPQLLLLNPKVKLQIENPDLAPQDIPETETDPNTGETAPVVDPNTGQPSVKIPRGTPVAMVGGEFVDAEEQVELLQSVDNYYLGAMKFKEKARRIINDALVLPYGVGKIEWVVEIERVEEPDFTTGQLKEIERVARQYPQFSRVKPWCFLWDPELDEFDFDQARWVAEIKYLSREEIQSDESLDVDFRELEDPSYILIEDSVSDDRDRKEIGRYKVYEIHDLLHKKFLVWIEGSEKMARVEDPSYYSMVEGSIYTVLGFDEAIDDSFPMPITKQIISQAQAYNKMLSYMVNHAARFNRKYKMMEQAMAESEEEKLYTGADGSIVKVKDMSMGPEPIIDAPITPDVYAVKDILKREITESIGVTSYSRGTREVGVSSATESGFIQQGQDLKIEEKREVVKEWANSIVRKLNVILKRYADSPTVTKIVGSRGQRWLKWTKEDIQGEYLEEVDIYSSQPFAEEIQKKQALEKFSLLAADPFTDPFKLRKALARTWKEDENVFYTEAEYAEIQQQQQAQQQQMMEQQEAQRQSAQTIRPTEGEIQRGSDMQAGIVGSARKIR